MSDCEKCLHKPVCKEIENWKKYCEEHIRLREKSILFDSEPRCPFYVEDKNLTNIEKQCILSNMINQEDEDNKEAIKTLENVSSKPVSIRFDNGSEIKTIPHNGNIRGKRAEMDIVINIDNLASIDDNNINDLINKMIRDGVL